jgi:hypothetical protein
VRTTQQQARFAGLLYLLLGLTAPLGLVYVPTRILVDGDAAATADNLRRLDGLVHAGIASELVHQVIAVFVVLALYDLFKDVHKGLARQVVIFGALLSVPIVFVNVLNEVAALALANGAGYLSAFGQAQRDALAYLFIHLHGRGVNVASMFWGLWLFPFGLLVIRCGFIPRVFGWLLLVAGVGYVAGSFVALVTPQLEAAAVPVVGLLVLGELPVIFWLAIRGATPGAAEPSSA